MNHLKPNTPKTEGNRMGRITNNQLLITIFTVLLLSSFAFTLLNIGCSRSRQPKELKIGAILPLTGDAAKYGQSTKNGIDLALEEINLKGGINVGKIDVIYEDSQADPKKAVSIFQKMTTVDKISFFLGPLSSSEVLAVAPTANKKKVIILAPAASSPQITNAGDYIFRNVMSDLFDGRVVADFAFNNLGKKTAGIIYINNDFGVGLKESFKSFFEKYGGKVVTEEVFDVGATDFRTQLVKIKKSSPEIVFLVGQSEMGYILRQSTELGLKTQWVSFSMFEDPQILEIAGNAAEGVYYTYRVFDPKSDIPVVKNFADSFREKYGQEPDIFAGLAYDATKILAQAVENGEQDAEKVKEALCDIKDFPGVVGTTSFDENGDVMKPIGIKKIENGEFVWVNKEFEMTSEQ